MKDGAQVPVPPHLEGCIEKGATWSVFTRVAIGVVDQAGERPGSGRGAAGERPV
ncbi:hypothetical protein HD597_004601 [Nonomuraea thailandensis]|uniref:Uncharacterized protein n=1 Tax=Nonomuraea thailandensis TaxID=1188745 RepID=A0A9X2K5F6_9ACTN|nr:hypothetical protein [Nonomuraea thailandensis]MCP2357581.1 hypothetical protein [Nonomuraea thailandensis]